MSDTLLDDIYSAIQLRSEWLNKPVSSIECTTSTLDTLKRQDHFQKLRKAVGIKAPREETIFGLPIKVNDELKEPFRLID